MILKGDEINKNQVELMERSERVPAIEYHATTIKPLLDVAKLADVEQGHMHYVIDKQTMFEYGIWLLSQLNVESPGEKYTDKYQEIDG